MADKLAKILSEYRKRADIVPSETWVFPSIRTDGEHLVDVRDDKRGVGGAHHLRHTFRTTLARLGVPEDQCKLLMGHSMSGSVSRGCITSALVLESLRPLTN